MEYSICVIIVNYHTATLTLNCVDTLRNQLNWNEDHIVIVDNNSGERERQKIKKGIKKRALDELVTFIQSKDNRGFSAGNNIGIKAVNAKFYLLANSDTLFRHGAISGLRKATKKYPQAGLISPRLEWPDGKPQVSCFRFHSPPQEAICSAATSVVTSVFNRYLVPLQICDHPTWPDWTSFACIMIRREVFEKIDFLDEGYFMYFEDVDYCRRAKKAGFPVLNYPDSRVVHLRGQSSNLKKNRKRKKRLPCYYYRSRSRYYTKFYGNAGYLFANLFWMGGRLISFVRERFQAKGRTVAKYSLFDIWQR